MPTDRLVRFYCIMLAICITMLSPDLAAPTPARGASPSISGIARISQQILRKTDAGNGSYRVDLDLGGSRVELFLVPYSLRSAQCEAVAEGPGGIRTRIELPPSRTYRGTVAGGAKGIVAASIDGDLLKGRIILDDGSDWWIEPMPKAANAAGSPGGGGAAGAAHAIYRGEDVTDVTGKCANEPTPAESQAPLEAPRSTEPLQASLSPQSLESQSSGCLEAEIAFEGDYAYYQWNGSSSTQTINDIDAVMNSVDLIYSRDVRINYRVTQYLIQTSNTGKYPSTDPGTKLSQFKDWWNANQGSVTRDMAHLMTGVDMSGLLGISMMAVVCTTSQAYGLSHSPGTVFANRVCLTAHELGHNWSATHCDNLDNCWIMCSHVSGCAYDPTRFSPRSIQEIGTYRDLSGSCLAAGSGTTTALNPTATDDHSVTVRGGSVTVNVLANDFDPNCQTISVSSYSPVTANGGTITASGDALVYRPAPTFIGQDSFQYTVRDAGGAQTTANVTVDVEDYRVPDTPTGAVAGVQARYYNTPPLDGSLGSMPALSNPFLIETLPTLSFPSTSGPFGESGMKDRVAARCTGTLNITQSDVYTFYLTSDDGSMLYIDGALLVNDDGIHTMQERSASLNLASGTHTVRVDYYDVSGPAGLLLEMQSSTMARSAIPSYLWSSPGVQVAYYALDSHTLPQLAALVPEKTQVVSSINYPFSWGTFAGSGRSVNAGAVFEGYMTVPADNVYFFELMSEDGSRFYVGDQLVVDNDGDHARVSMTGGIALRAGAHKFHIDYFLRDGGCALTLQVWSSSLSKQIVPASWFTHLTGFHVPTDYATINAAITAATTNSMVWVAAGTYSGSGNTNLDLQGKNISLVGGGGADITILDGLGTGRVFNFVNHSQANASIQGFSIQRGNATGAGGAMLFTNSSLHVRDCYIEGSTSTGNGGAIALLSGSSPTFENCVISGNRATGAGGGIDAEGTSHPTFLGCTVSGNSAGTSGGGAYSTNGGWVTFQQSILWGNAAPTNGPEAWTNDGTSTVDFACSDVLRTGVGGNGAENFGANILMSDPEFCVPGTGSQAPTTGGGYRVVGTSPVLESANPCGVLIGAMGQGCGISITAVESAPTVPATALEQNVPNPFNPETRISFSTQTSARATLRIFDAAGRLVTTLLDRGLPAGRHDLTWRGTDSRNRSVASGVYFYQLRTEGNVLTRSMVLLK